MSDFDDPAGTIRLNPVELHYDRFAEREWERLDRHRMEFAVTCRVLDEQLPPPPGRILDVGGGPGRYALYLTQLGYRVTLIDLSQRSLDLALEKEMCIRDSLYRRGLLDLERLVSQVYPLERINEAYADMLSGRIARGVIAF